MRPPSYLESDQQHTGPQLPPGTGKLGMWLILAALFMLFAATVVAYVVIRLTGSYSPPRGVIQMPVILWGSTLAMVGSSVTLHLALTAIRRGRLERFRLDMLGTLILTGLFLAMQVPGLMQLLSIHQQQMTDKVHIYGLVFMIILLHALHILGGLIPLCIAVARSQKDAYTQDSHEGILYLTMYWHFLDAVWIALFAMFLILG